MKKFLLTLLLALCIGSVGAWAETATFDLSAEAKKYSSGDIASASVSDGDATLSFTGSPKWYTSHLRVYAGDAITISVPQTYKITSIETVISGSYPLSTAGLSSGSYSSNTNKWTPSTGKDVNSVTITNKGSKQARFSKLIVTYESLKKLETLESVTVAPTTIVAGLKGELIVSEPADFYAGVGTVSYASSNKDAILFGDGAQFITGVAGESEITVSWTDGEKYAAGSYSFTFTVTEPEPAKEANAKFENLTVAADDEGVITCSSPEDFFQGIGEIIYVSSDTNIFDIDENGNWQAYTPGTVTVTAAWTTGLIYLEGEAEFTVTVTKAKPAFAFASTTLDVNLGTELTMPVLNNPAKLPCTTTFEGNAAAILSPANDGTIWLLNEGTATLTASFAGNDEYEPATAELTINVLPHLPATQTLTATFDFTHNGAYGMEAQSGNSSDYHSGNICTEGDVNLALNKYNGAGVRLWTKNQDYELRVMKSSQITISVPQGYLIKEIVFTNGFGGDFNCSELTDGLVWKSLEGGAESVSFTATSAGRMDIATIKVTYEIPGVQQHLASTLSFNGNRTAFADGSTIAGATIDTWADGANIGYKVLDAEGADAELVELEVAENGSLYILGEEGEYTLMAYHGLTEYLLPGIATTKLTITATPEIETLYLHGHFYNRYFDLSQPVEMTKEGKVFTARGIRIGGNHLHTSDDYAYLFTTHRLPAAPESTEGGEARRAAAAHDSNWADLSEGYVYHAAGIAHAADITSHEQLKPYTVDADGTYNFTADFTDAANPQFSVEKFIETGVEGVSAAENAEAEYFDLTGRRVSGRPAAGIYIRRQGGVTAKVAL